MREQNKEYVCLIKPGKSTELSIQFLFSYKMDDDNLWKKYSRQSNITPYINLRIVEVTTVTPTRNASNLVTIVSD